MRFIIAALVTIGLIILIIVLLLRGGGAPAPKPISLPTYAGAPGSYAELNIDGPIVAEPNHQGLTIDVSQDTVTLTIYKGYERNTIKSQTYPNTADAYKVFLFALQHANFTAGTSAGSISDERGYCPDGMRYSFRFNNGDKDVLNYWRSSCGQGTFEGMFGTVMSLFKNQVPDYDDQVRGVTTVF